MRITTDLNEAEKIILIDYSAIAYQAYYSAPSNQEGRFIDICLGIIRSFVRFGDVFAICFVVDSTPTRKLLIYREYKGKRKKGDEDPKEVMLPALRFFKALRYKVQGEEADDIIATLCTQLRDKQKIIATTDSDLKAMISKNTRVINPQSFEFVEGDTTTALLTILEKYVCGDSSDNIPPIRKRIRKELVKDAIIAFISGTDKLTSVRTQFTEYLKSNVDLKIKDEEIDRLALNMELITPRRDLNLKPEPFLPTVKEYREFLAVAEESLFDYPTIGLADALGKISHKVDPKAELMFSSADSQQANTKPETDTTEVLNGEIDSFLGGMDDLFEDDVA
ncbi:hypothetical protein [Bdellovibrio sp. BCCA]|uniref:hypothetical protein n=1 Tax=Bdellovibrio sp. BCCA TaxID=3136281 RepID=UPI0030F11DF3